MMLKHHWRYLLPISFLAIIFYPVLILEVKIGKSDKMLFFEKVSPGDPFEFHYIHSVDKTPVSGHFLITPEKMIKPIETRFRSYGPGLPSTGKGVVMEEGVIKARQEAGEMKRFSFFVSPFTQQSLYVKGRRLDFSTLKEGEVVIIEIKQVPLGGLIFKHGKK